MLNLFLLVARNYICDFISISHKRNKSVLRSNRCLLWCILSNEIKVPMKGGSRLTLFAGNGIVRVKQTQQ